MKKAFLTCITECHPALSDVNLLKQYLRKNGWSVSKSVDAADVVIVYTCASTKASEDVSLKAIRRFQRTAKVGANLIVSGCLPAINKDRLNRVFDGVVVPAKSLHEFDQVVEHQHSLRDIQYAGPDRQFKKDKATEYPLRIEWGCDGNCSYCAIKFVFGKPKSRPVSEILLEFERAFQKGYRNIMLVGNDSGSYGKDIGTSLTDLLDELCKMQNECWFSLSHISPHKLKAMLPSLSGIIRSGRISRINLPVQSGSDRIIKLMNRKYTVADFKYCINKLTAYCPGIQLKTDFIVGFPSETEKDFSATLKLAEWLRRRNVYFNCFPYSERPKTAALKLPGKIDRMTQLDRLQRLSRPCPAAPDAHFKIPELGPGQSLPPEAAAG
jgi:MiaB/RimO family radical SAM methylthiotransferase